MTTLRCCTNIKIELFLVVKETKANATFWQMVYNIAYPVGRGPFDLPGEVGKKTFLGRSKGPLLAG